MGDFILGYSYASPLVIMQALSIFLLFSRINIQSKTINWLAASCLSIFLIHMHPAIKEIRYYSFSRGLYDLPILQHLFILGILMGTVFFASILIDKIRMIISSGCYFLLSKLACIIPLRTHMNTVLDKIQ
jgi:surface polysaccharide O-acyltransferase-like enzyme